MVSQGRLRGMFFPLAVVSFLIFACVAWAQADVLYVKHDAVGANDGSSWGDAYTLLQSALDVSVSGDEIWVAAGTYKPTYDYGLGIGDRGKHFRMKNGVGIYGGFAGTETEREQRDWDVNVTILSGDIGVEGDASDNCYHVFYHPGAPALDASAVLDGVVVTAGKADGGAPHHLGGAMYNYSSSATLTNCAFSENSADFGGGMYNGYSSPTVTSCTFSGNSAVWSGGGVHNYYSSPTVTNCTFSENSGSSGGGMLNFGSSPSVTSCTFSGNLASGSGGGMYDYSSSPVVTNCTFSGNSGSSGGGIYNYSSSPAVTNTILWENSAPTGAEVYNEEGSSPTFLYSAIAGCGGSGAEWDGAMGTDGGGNIDADPLFVDAANGDFRVKPGSPCIDAADGEEAPETDKDGNARYDDPGTPNTGVGPPWADMGAYEFPGAYYQPADPNTDWSISISEVVAYAVAWKSGATWPVPPNPIPISYVVNAAVIWKSGEAYYYDQSQPAPCWRPGP